MVRKTNAMKNKNRPKRKNSPLRPKAKQQHADFEEKPGSIEVDELSSQEVQTIEETQLETPKAQYKKGTGVRLQKLLADRGYGSRRKMEGWIKQGKVEVNGAKAELGQRVTLKDKIKVNGHGLREKMAFSKTKVLMYNKPEGEICTMNDPRRRPTVFRNLPRIRGARWVAVGRLDINTAGLLLFTTNGELANKLMHPSAGIEREYRCRIFGNFTKEMTEQLTTGIQIDHHLLKFNRVIIMDNMEDDKRNKWVHVTLAEGRNREVRKLWEAIGCQVSRLTRVRYGFLTLPRDLRQGQSRELTNKEVTRLLKEDE